MPESLVFRNRPKFVDRGTFFAVPRASKTDNSCLRSRGETEIRSEWVCDRESSILLRFRDFVALVLRGFISNSFYLSLPELFSFFSFFASVTSPPLLVLERDNAPFHGFESRLFSSCSVAGLGEKVEIKTGGVS